MNILEILNYCTENFEDVVVNKNWGEIAIFYNPLNTFKKGTYLLTIKEKDGENDRSSNLNRNGVFRLNIGIKKESFIDMFSFVPKRPKAGNIVDMDFDFTRKDKIMPHPIYGWMNWISVINPSYNTFEKLKPLIADSYLLAQEKFINRYKKLK